MGSCRYGRYDTKKKARHRRKPGKKKYKRPHRIRNIISIILFGLFVAAVGTGVSFAYGAYTAVINDSPVLQHIDAETTYASYIYNSEGKVTSKLMSTDSSSIPVKADQIPDTLKHAFVAIEDKRFYTHQGIDTYGILRAVAIGLKTKNFSQGASTITQQYIKNSAFHDWVSETPIESVRRKLQEQHLALQLEQEASKDEIITDYLNIINLGHGTYGVQAASLTYFNKDVSELNVSECAVIAAITQNPSRYDPITHPEENKTRRAEVLTAMLEQQYISEEEYEEALADDVYTEIAQATAERNAKVKTVNSYFDDELIRQVVADLEAEGYSEANVYSLLYTGGLKIYSTQDAEIQAAADAAANNPDNYPGTTKYYPEYALSISNADGTVSNYSSQTMKAWRKKNGKGSGMLFKSEDAAKAAAEEYRDALLADGGSVIAETFTAVLEPQISMTISDQRTGNVLAVVGGRGDKTANMTLDRATQSLRQPGSTFKIVAAYAPALNDCGMRLDTIYKDEEYYYASGQKVNNWYGNAYRGDVTIEEAIADSMNIIAVKAITDVTPAISYKYLKKFGFTSLVENEEINGKVYSDIQQTLALGGLTKGVSNIELNASYATIANNGYYVEPKFYTKVVDHNGNVLLDTTDRTQQYVIKDSTAYLLTHAMESVVTKGTGKACKISGTPVAGKTGTTTDENDVWFAGYSNYYTCTTWAGYDDNTNLEGKQSRIAKNVWRDAMERIHKGLEKSEFEVPDSVVKLTICSKTGKIALKGACKDTYTQYYANTNSPTEHCTKADHGITEKKKTDSGKTSAADTAPADEEPATSDSAEQAPDTTAAEQEQQQADSATASMETGQPTDGQDSTSTVQEPAGNTADGSTAQSSTTGDPAAATQQPPAANSSISKEVAQSQADQAYMDLQNAAATLEQAKANLMNAQASGDANMISSAQTTYDEAVNAYNSCLSAYQQAEAVLQAAQ